MKKSIETLNQTDYQSIIQMAWQQFQSGHSIFSKDGGLVYWTRRTIVLDGEIDAFDWKIESSQQKNPKGK
jgi:hypothetical protein